jgi:hypothetical protein
LQVESAGGDHPIIGSKNATDAAKGRRFSSAVGAEQADNFSGLKLE